MSIATLLRSPIVPVLLQDDDETESREDDREDAEETDDLEKEVDDDEESDKGDDDLGLGELKDEDLPEVK